MLGKPPSGGMLTSSFCQVLPSKRLLVVVSVVMELLLALLTGVVSSVYSELEVTGGDLISSEVFTAQTIGVVLGIVGLGVSCLSCWGGVVVG